MQFTIQPSDPTPSPAEFLSGYLHRIHVAQSDALAILQRVMIQAARLLDEPEFEKPYQTRSTNERMRIAMRSAATIINMRLPKLPGEPPDPTRPSPSPRSRGEGAPRSSEGRKRGSLSASTATTTITTAAASSPLPPASSEPDASAREHAVLSGAERTKAGSETVRAAASTSECSAVLPQVSAVNVQLSALPPAPLPPLATQDSALTTSTPPLPSSAPSVTSVVNSAPPPIPSEPPVPLFDKNPPPPPPDLTFEEKASIYMRQQGVKVPFDAKIADKLRAWHLYTEKYGIKPPFNYTVESLLPPPRPRKPRRPRPPPSTRDATTRQPEATLQPALNSN